ncbi:MAG TPA: diaminopimelate epimerase [Patescibacteria group bacterium]|nr:diaminopimelate epimerase [Patescibacteria group bacterium]
MKIQKMQGIGNDFILYADFAERTTPDDVRKICDRNFGIGADGVITVTDSRIPEAVYRMKYFNSDGSFAQMCGNGIRCFAKYLLDNNLVKSKGKIWVDTDAGIIIPEVLENTESEAIVSVNMGRPIFYDSQQVLLTPDDKGLVQFLFNNMKGTYVGMGNPHIIFFVEQGKAKQYAELYGSQIENMRELFPQKINIGFVEVQDKKNLVVHVWERGCGLTLACGTNASAAFVAAVIHGFASTQAKVHLPGGTLEMSWAGHDAPVFLTGPARNVFEIPSLNFIKEERSVR